MCITQDHHLHCKMDDKEQFVKVHIAQEQFEAVLEYRNMSHLGKIPSIGGRSQLGRIM